MILDTNALSAFVDGSKEIGAVLTDVTEIAIPVIVLGEYRYGIALSTRRRRYETWLDIYLRFFRLLPISENTTIEYAALRVELRQNGRTIPANDVWIAALSREHHLPVLSRDAHFDRVAGLRRLSW